MPLEVGSRLGHYDVTAKIGESGMGEVYRARDGQLGVALGLRQAECPFSIIQVGFWLSERQS